MATASSSLPTESRRGRAEDLSRRSSSNCRRPDSAARRTSRDRDAWPTAAADHPRTRLHTRVDIAEHAIALALATSGPISVADRARRRPSLRRPSRRARRRFLVARARREDPRLRGARLAVIEQARREQRAPAPRVEVIEQDRRGLSASSSVQRLRPSPHSDATRLPVALLPVKLTLSIRDG